MQIFRNILKSRNSSTIAIDESSDNSPGAGLLSKLQDSIRKILNKEPASPIPISDAAVVMAADGYGRAEITGSNNNAVITITTYSTIITIRLASTILPQDLFAAINRRFEIIRKQRDIEHGDDKK